MFHSSPNHIIKVIALLFLAWGLFMPPQLPAAQTHNNKESKAQPAESPRPGPAGAKSGDLLGAISILEDDKKREEVLNLLKQLAAAEGQGADQEQAGDGGPDQEAEVESGLKSYLSGRLTSVLRDLRALPSALLQAGEAVKAVFGALSDPLAMDIWRPYALKIFIWGLFCLTCTFLIFRKYGPVPVACYSSSLPASLKALAKYIIVVAFPNLILILSLLAIPPLSPTLPGVTADMATGFALIHGFIQHFFVNFSALFIGLRLADALLSPGCDGRSIVNAHPITGKHLLHTWKVFSLYVALYIFIDETILNSFAGGLLYSLSLVIMTIPIPIYLTIRLAKLRKLVYLVNEAEASAGLEEEAPPQNDDPAAETTGRTPKLDYRVDLFVRKHWSSLMIAGVWILTAISLFNPLGLAGNFGGRIALSILIPAATAVVVRISRRLLYNMVNPDTEEGRRVLLKSDGLINIILWFAAAVLIFVVWGLPLESILENLVLQDIMARAFTIVVVLFLLGIFIRFSHVATDWLLSVPSLENNRNWRTITPLVLTTVRALAVFVTVVVILERLGVNIGPILAGAGILGLGVGMGAQSLVKDVINGISILMMDTLAVGDWVTVGGKSGTVMMVGIRSIRLRDSAGNLIVVPNSTIDTITNMTKDYSQDLIEFVAPYDADPDGMMKMASEVAAELSSDQNWKRYLTTPVSVVGVTAFDANGTTIRLQINTTAGFQWKVGRELRLRIKRRMMKDGITSNWFGQNLFLHRGDSGGEASEAVSGLGPDDETVPSPGGGSGVK